MKKILLLFVSVMLAFASCQSLTTEGRDYSIPQVDLSEKPEGLSADFDSLFELYNVDDGSENGSTYMAHPDSILLEDSSILTLYPQGHGYGPVIGKRSTDGGKSWGSRLTTLPESWKESKETPTIYRLGTFNDANDPLKSHLVMISANPSWGGSKGNLYGHSPFQGDGFNASISADDGATWSDFETWFGYGEKGYVNSIVAMASLTRLKKADGSWDNRWMGLFHDYDYVNYISELTLNEDGSMNWSLPRPYMAHSRAIERTAGLCEVETIRSESGKGDKLVLLGRSNKKRNNSLISVSVDEGKTWSVPVEAPSALSGERHKAEWLPDGRLFVTFRSIERDPAKNAEYSEKPGRGWYSEGWIGWVGTLEDILSGGEGQYRVKLAHTYLPGQSGPEVVANADTGYCGNVVLADGTLMTSTYGCFGETYTGDDGEVRFKTTIAAKRIDVKLLDRLVEQLK